MSRRTFTLLLLMSIALQACGGFNRVRVELKSIPDGAEVETILGEKLGTTPFILKDENLQKAMRDGRIMVLLASPGYATRELLMDAHGEDSHEVRLNRLDEEYFTKRLMTDFSRQSNELSRELLQIQGLLIVNKLAEAERQLEAFQKKFPSIAAGHVMLGNIEAARGNLDRARGYFKRARSIDPSDPVIARLLGLSVEEARQPASSSPTPVTSPAPSKEPSP